MATIELTLTTAQQNHLIAAIEVAYGADVLAAASADTNKKKLLYHLVHSLETAGKSVKRTADVSSAVASEVTARASAETALAAEHSARVSAEATADAASATLLGGIS